MKLDKIKNSKLYNTMFGFEKNIDLNDDVAVLFRKNVVIKNIIFISNLVYTLIFMIASIGEASNWFFTIILFPLTFMVNHTLKKMIYNDEHDKVRQIVSMYMCCFYMFLSALIIYARLKTGPTASYLGEVGYVLLYYSLIICSFYQDKRMLKSVYSWVIVIITIIHFTLTYNLIFSSGSTGENNFLHFFVSNEFKDILLRTVILLAFMLVLYISVSIVNYMQDERKKELRRRKELEVDFTNVLSKLYETALGQKSRNKSHDDEIILLSKMVMKLASLLGKDTAYIKTIGEYSRIHLDEDVDFYLENEDDDVRFAELKKEASLATKIILRLQLENLAEDLIRAHIEGDVSDDFTNSTREMISDVDSQLIMLCDMYITLRSIRSYKRAYNHNQTIEYLESVYRIYFDAQIFDRFIRFNSDFETMFDDFKEV